MPPRRVRNYRAMGDGKLMRCLRELEARSGEAYDVCIARGYDPSVDLAEARHQAQSRSLSLPGQPNPPRATPPAPPSRVPACRWCGGDGIEPGTSLRAAETARLVFHLTKWDGRAPGAAGRTGKPWRGNVSRVRQESSTTLAAPLAEVLAAAEKLLADGYKVVEGDLPDASLACERCHGTGKP